MHLLEGTSTVETNATDYMEAQGTGTLLCEMPNVLKTFVQVTLLRMINGLRCTLRVVATLIMWKFLETVPVTVIAPMHKHP